MEKAKEAYCDLDCFNCWRPDCTCPSAECVVGVYDMGGAPDDWQSRKSARKKRVVRRTREQLAEEYYTKKRKMIREIIEREQALYRGKTAAR